MMKKIAASEGMPTDTSRDYEFTDWLAVDEFAHTLAEELHGAAASPAGGAFRGLGRFWRRGGARDMRTRRCALRCRRMLGDLPQLSRWLFPDRAELAGLLLYLENGNMKKELALILGTLVASSGIVGSVATGCGDDGSGSTACAGRHGLRPNCSSTGCDGLCGPVRSTGTSCSSSGSSARAVAGARPALTAELDLEREGASPVRSPPPASGRSSLASSFCMMLGRMARRPAALRLPRPVDPPEPEAGPRR